MGNSTDGVIATLAERMAYGPPLMMGPKEKRSHHMSTAIAALQGTTPARSDSVTAGRTLRFMSRKDTVMSEVTRTRSVASRMVLAALGAIAVATSMAMGAPQPAAAASLTYTYNTDAWCIGQTDVMAGLHRMHINGAFPTGTTNGATYLAARAQDANSAGIVVANHRWVTWTNGSQWARTTVDKFPLGQFAISGSWYRRMNVFTSEDWLNTTPYHRIQFKLQWPNGAVSYSYTRWVMC